MVSSCGRIVLLLMSKRLRGASGNAAITLYFCILPYTISDRSSVIYIALSLVSCLWTRFLIDCDWSLLRVGVLSV